LPSLDQLRNEEFADAVERARALPILVHLFVSTPELLPVRVLMKDARELEFKLSEVDLDGRQLVGLDTHGAPMQIPLDAVEAVSHRRPLVRRTIILWVSTTMVGALLGLGDDQFRSTQGALIGALSGALAGGLLSWMLQDSPSLHEWRRLYGGRAA